MVKVQSHVPTSESSRPGGRRGQVVDRRARTAAPVLIQPHSVPSGVPHRLSSGQEVGSLGASLSLWPSEQF